MKSNPNRVISTLPTYGKQKISNADQRKKVTLTHEVCTFRLCKQKCLLFQNRAITRKCDSITSMTKQNQGTLRPYTYPIVKRNFIIANTAHGRKSIE